MNHFRLRLLACLSSLVVVSLLALPALAANETRVALVIGNTAYTGEERLTNPVNDARALADSLRKVGFELVDGKPLLDLNKQETEKAIQRFGRAIRGADVALFFYSGHGTQVDEKNYIVPVGAVIQTKSDVKYNFVSADFVLQEMDESKSKTNIIILDACRNNPFASKGFRGSARGLAAMDAPRNTLIAYATAPGKTASDAPTQGNSPYSAALSKNLLEPGQTIEEVFRKVRKDVYRSTNGEQSPWESTNLYDAFYFIPPTAATAQQATPPVDPEVVYWQSIVNSNNLASFEAYLNKYPQGQFASLAKVKIADLKPKPQPQSVSTPSSIQQPATTQAASTSSLPKVGDIWTEPVTGMKFVWVPGGTYEMGCGSWAKECSDDEKPVHTVTVNGFWLGIYEVTQGQWKKVMGNNPSKVRSDEYPVEQVSWDDVQKFLSKLNKPNGSKFRLPTEAEWEYAARSGGKNEIYSGGNDFKSVARWHDVKAYDPKKYALTYSVGGMSPNGLGLYDMSGNVGEWVADFYSEDAYSRHARLNPLNAVKKTDSVVRGGNAERSLQSITTHYRGYFPSDISAMSIGFRVALGGDQGLKFLPPLSSLKPGETWRDDELGITFTK